MKGLRNVVVTTLGCKVNQCESEAIEKALGDADFQAVDGGSQSADVVVVNTCSVTGKAAMQSRQAVRRAIRRHPGARIIVTGCHAQTAPDDFTTIKGVDCVIGNRDKHRIPEKILSQMVPANPTGPTNPTNAKSLPPQVLGPDISNTNRFESGPAIAHGGRTRPFVKIQDGCNAFCTYCIVPHARGRSRSLPVDRVLSQLETLGQAGYREVVLTGIHIGCYGQDLTPRTSLFDLLCRIREAGAIGRVRVSSIEPGELTDDIIDLAAGKNKIPGRLCRHFHIPLQSGDNTILKRMHRPYTVEYFHDLVLRIAERIPDVSIGIDTLIGFPGETEEAFENTVALIRKVPASYLHVFPFSPRKGTPAFNYSDPIHPSIVKERCKTMRRLGDLKRNQFYKRFFGATAEVLVEETRDRNSGQLKGFSENYIPILFDGPEALFNTFQPVKIRRILENGTPEGVLVDA